jgi:hypothetical protein
MSDMVNIVRMNAYIQRNMGKLFLFGKEILCVSLDRTCTFTGEGGDDIMLTDAQLEDLLGQTYGKAPATSENRVKVDEALVVDSDAIAINDNVKMLPRGEQR